MVAKIIILILLLAMVTSLGLAMASMMRDKGRGTGTVKALTYRVGIWAVLFLLIVAGLYTGVITPGNSLHRAAVQSDK
ncbi:MAG TPA: twin transmembrane helix small protein [Arenicellales bacterium]|nr:twin transmembrane helix small protein [Arenicellales bacterium]